VTETREPQYQNCIELRDEIGLTPLGLMANQVWYDDPRRLTFVLARYKFAAKMLAGKQRVLEVGCADAFATRIVQQSVGEVIAIDFDPVFVEDVNNRMEERWRFTCMVHDMLSGPVPGERFNAAYSIDVLEHIMPEHEDTFIQNICNSLQPHGVAVIGSPSIQSQAYASPPSKAGHVNCKDGAEFKALMQKYFHNVFLFSMNDEVVHTGFHPMAHYLFVLGVGQR